MLDKWKLPDYKTIRYTLNTTNNWYQLQLKPDSFKKLPEELKIRPVICPSMKKQAENLIEGRTVNKRKTFFTGLSATRFENLFSGDDGYNQPKKKSFILFHFSKDKTVLICYFFNDYTPPATLRVQFIETFRQSIKQNK
jgi:hypothetical protein